MLSLTLQPRPSVLHRSYNTPDEDHIGPTLYLNRLERRGLGVHERPPGVPLSRRPIHWVQVTPQTVRTHVVVPEVSVSDPFGGGELDALLVRPQPPSFSLRLDFVPAPLDDVWSRPTCRGCCRSLLSIHQGKIKIPRRHVGRIVLRPYGENADGNSRDLKVFTTAYRVRDMPPHWTSTCGAGPPPQPCCPLRC